MLVWAIILLIASFALGALGLPKAAKASRVAAIVLLGLIAAMVIGAAVLLLIVVGILA